MKNPVIILVRPQLPENIGACARAMSNFGLTELRLVAPREGWPQKRALEIASGAASIIEAAQVFADTKSAVADIQLAYGTTSRGRDIAKRVVTPQELMPEIHASISGKIKIALMFGPERTGLENDDLSWCDAFITIPTAENASLNLAQSVVVMGYEWWKMSGEWQVVSGEKESGADLHSPLTTCHSPLPAPLKDWNGLFNQLENYLDEAGYFRVAHKKLVMWQNLKNMLLRGRFSAQEIRSFRGMLRLMWEGRKPRRK